MFLRTPSSLMLITGISGSGILEITFFMSSRLAMFYVHLAVGGIDINIASVDPPVFSPNKVPLSHIKLNSTYLPLFISCCSFSSLDHVWSLCFFTISVIDSSVCFPTSFTKAEETKTGTLELLITQPISIFKIILSKYLSASFLAVLTILPTLIYYISVYQMGEITGNIDHPSTIGGYLGLLLQSITYVAIGILASSLSKNQVIGFLLGLFFNFIIYVGFSYLAVFVGDPLDYYLMNLSMLDHFTALQRGIIDSRDIAYFLSVIFFTLYITKIVLKKK